MIWKERKKKMNKEVYVLTLEMYNEWAWENGACDVIGVYDDLSILEKI